MTNGTAQKCDCCGRETLAHLRPDIGAIEVHDRRHGTVHTAILSLSSLVQILDPRGTSYIAVGSSGK